MMESIFTDNWFQAKTVKEKQAHIKKQLGFIPSVVYLDDEKELLPLFEHQVNQMGFEVFTTSNHEDAIFYITQFVDKIAFIVSDFKMPKVSGLDFRSSILENTKHIPFFILSGYIDADTVIKGAGLSIAAFFDKPFSEKKFTHFFQRRSLSQEVLAESDAFLQKNGDATTFWRRVLNQTRIDLYLVSSEHTAPMKAEILDMDEENMSLEVRLPMEFNEKELFVKFLIIDEGKEKKILFKTMVEEVLPIQNDSGVGSQLELKIVDLKKEDFVIVYEAIQKRQEMINQYLSSLQKQKNN